MQVNIFYSWQSNLPDSTNQTFIENCLEKAIKKLSIDDTFSLELRIDMDTKGISFSPDVMSTVFAKIESSQIFVADITLINRRCAKNSKNQIKRTPNPNVLIELGYAAALLGWNNVILVYNTAYGEVEELPFDLRGRKPLTYHLNSDEDKTEKEKHLIEAFASAFQEQRELFKNHPITKLHRFCESKFFWMQHEVELLILNMRYSVKERLIDQSLENITKEEVEKLCLKIKPKAELETFGEKAKFFSSWYDYLGYKTSRIKKRIQELITLYNVLDIEILELITEIDTELTDYLELEGKDWDNLNLSVQYAPIYRLTQLVQQLYQCFKTRYDNHRQEYQRQQALK